MALLDDYYKSIPRGNIREDTKSIRRRREYFVTSLIWFAGLLSLVLGV